VAEKNEEYTEIRKGDRIRITIPGGQGIFDSFGAGWGEGIVLSAYNAEWDRTKKPNWYLEVEKDKVSGRNWQTGYGYWKQGQDGGEVKLISRAAEHKA
jgi:hypothetical protein